MTDLLLPRRARGRPSPNAEATYQEQRQAFCALIQEIWSTMDFAVGVRGWCYILEGRGHATKGEFDACENFITDCRKTGDLSAPVGWSPDNLIIERFGLNFDFIEANNLTWIDNLETSSGQRLDDRRQPADLGIKPALDQIVDERLHDGGVLGCSFDHAVDFIKRNANANKPFYAYVSFSLFHFPTLPNPEFVGKTGNGDWADCLAEMDYRAGQILDAIKEAGIEENTIVIFASDNGPEATHPWEGDGGPWRGTYFT